MVSNVEIVVHSSEIDDLFKASGKRLLSAGWKTVYGADSETQEDDKKDEDLSAFPLMSIGDKTLCQSTKLKASKTTPPAKFTEASLLMALLHVYELVDDPDLKKRLQSTKGIGTPATRHTIFETLLQRGFLNREKKHIVSTPIGRSLIDICPPKMVDPAWTALWENAFDGIAKSDSVAQAQMRYKTFMDKQNEWVKQLLFLAPKSDFSKLPIDPKKNVEAIQGHGQQCPKCDKGQMLTREIKQGKSKGRSFLGCSNYPTCSHSIWPS
jgi:DNA topoisomerase-3